VDYVIEGELLPKYVAELHHRYPLQIKACFLGYTAITPAQKLREIRTNAGYPNDWSSECSDSDLLNIITRMIEFSRYLMDECKTYNLRYFDTSHNFVQTLDQVVAYISEDSGGTCHEQVPTGSE
jgi:hypothetical protein